MPDDLRTTLAARVAKGATLLDRERPGWADEIDLGKLDLNSGCRCVLGQLHGPTGEYGESSPFYLYAQDLFGPSFLEVDRGTVEHGFIASGSDESNAGAYAVLDELWIEQIRARQAASVTP